jgi:tetratricopeptide (TPR) repeat protein
MVRQQQRRPERGGSELDEAALRALQAAGRDADVIAMCRRALAINPRRPGLRGALVTALLNTGAQNQGDAALDEIIRLLGAIIIEEHGSGVWLNLMSLKPLAQDLERLVGILRDALAQDPYNSELLDNYSILLKDCQRWDEAERTARLAYQYSAGNTRLHFHLGLLLLLRGDFSAGFHAFERRWDEALRSLYPPFTQPRWRGEPLAGRTLLLWGEQGMGDVLLGSRYVPMLAERVHREGGRLVWNTMPALGDLLRRSFHGHYDIFCTGGSVQTLPRHDLEVALLSLPFLFDTHEETIPGPARYVMPDPSAAARWRERLAGETRLKVGLAWMGGPNNNRNAFRSVGLMPCAKHFTHLTGKVAFYSLQPNTGSEIAAARATGFEIADYSAEWKSFDDTAAFIDSLDLVMTVCTSIAHLSGALGQRTWVLLDANPYWVWQLERRDSPWYPNTMLYRQKSLQLWDGVLDEVSANLAALAQERVR